MGLKRRSRSDRKHEINRKYNFWNRSTLVFACGFFGCTASWWFYFFIFFYEAWGFCHLKCRYPIFILFLKFNYILMNNHQTEFFHIFDWKNVIINLVEVIQRTIFLASLSLCLLFIKMDPHIKKYGSHCIYNND